MGCRDKLGDVKADSWAIGPFCEVVVVSGEDVPGWVWGELASVGVAPWFLERYDSILSVCDDLFGDLGDLAAVEM